MFGNARRTGAIHCESLRVPQPSLKCQRRRDRADRRSVEVYVRTLVASRRISLYRLLASEPQVRTGYMHARRIFRSRHFFLWSGERASNKRRINLQPGSRRVSPASRPRCFTNVHTFRLHPATLLATDGLGRLVVSGYPLFRGRLRATSTKQTVHHTENRLRFSPVFAAVGSHVRTCMDIALLPILAGPKRKRNPKRSFQNAIKCAAPSFKTQPRARPSRARGAKNARLSSKRN